MVSTRQSLLSIENLTLNDVEDLFKRATFLETAFQNGAAVRRNRVVALLFAEPSTRTRVSFEMAAHRLGLQTVVCDNPATSSLAKGESLADTVLNVAAMQPDLLVIRYNKDEATDSILKELKFPVINAGTGTQEHPTQALLDAYTIKKCRGQVSGEKVLFLGDVVHSRVANSNRKLLALLGAEVAYCGPDSLTPAKDSLWQDVKRFSGLNEGLAWASVLMGLRMQKERHIGIAVTQAQVQNYQVNAKNLISLRADGIIMHPGPVLWREEFADEVAQDPRYRVLDQVTNGVFIRAALMSKLLNIEV